MVEQNAPRDTPIADFSPERRAHAIRLLRGEKVLTDPRLTDDARLLFSVTLLICDDSGFARKTDVDRAVRDPSIVNIARQIMTEATL